MQSKRRGLWGQTQRELIAADTTEEGKQLLRLWRHFDSFQKPNVDYPEGAKECARKFPIDLVFSE